MDESISPPPASLVVLDARTAQAILASKGQTEVRVSPDLGLTQVNAQLTVNGVTFPSGETASWDEIHRMVKGERKCFWLHGSSVEEIRTYSQVTGWVRSLVPTSGAPTTLVGGIPMHRIKDTDPWIDTRSKIDALGRPRGRVLDTATGLGYTAIEAAKTADHVLTIEIDPAALEIARLNPWSAGLFSSSKIEIREGDSFEVIAELPDRQFDAILHDPPTLALGGELYSSEFYTHLRRVLRPSGKLFHYVGDPNSGQGARTTNGVIRRLHEAGFRTVARRPQAFGLVAIQ